MRRFYVLASMLLLVGGLVGGSALREAAAGQALPTVTVYKSPTCGCCAKWVEHLRANGFEVRTTDMPDVSPMKQRLGVPRTLGSCHTAVVDGYVVEGHVPASDVKRLLSERPEVTGLAVPGMPIGSPGMEGPNPEAYEVIAFNKNGTQAVFSRH